MQIWTEVIDDETLNILHIHVNDTSDMATMDSAFVHPGESLDNFKEFKNDMSGRPLKYKILVYIP